MDQVSQGHHHVSFSRTTSTRRKCVFPRRRRRVPPVPSDLRSRIPRDEETFPGIRRRTGRVRSHLLLRSAEPEQWRRSRAIAPSKARFILVLAPQRGSSPAVINHRLPAASDDEEPRESRRSNRWSSSRGPPAHDLLPCSSDPQCSRSRRLPHLTLLSVRAWNCEGDDAGHVAFESFTRRGSETQPPKRQSQSGQYRFT